MKKENEMNKKNNPFKVPEGYFEQLNTKLLEKAEKKHVSSPKLFRYVASISAVAILALSVWIVAFQNDNIGLKQNDTFSFLFNGKSAQEKAGQEALKAEEAQWQRHKAEMKKQAEQIVFTEDELQYLEYFVEEDEREIILTATDN
ncbi:MAG: hypothetical protein ACI3Z9_03655 [Candidatus Onthomorpha sp.]